MLFFVYGLTFRFWTCMRNDSNGMEESPFFRNSFLPQSAMARVIDLTSGSNAARL